LKSDLCIIIVGVDDNNYYDNYSKKMYKKTNQKHRTALINSDSVTEHKLLQWF